MVQCLLISSQIFFDIIHINKKYVYLHNIQYGFHLYPNYTDEICIWEKNALFERPSNMNTTTCQVNLILKIIILPDGLSSSSSSVLFRFLLALWLFSLPKKISSSSSSLGSGLVSSIFITLWLCLSCSVSVRMPVEPGTIEWTKWVLTQHYFSEFVCLFYLVCLILWLWHQSGTLQQVKLRKIYLIYKTPQLYETGLWFLLTRSYTLTVGRICFQYNRTIEVCSIIKSTGSWFCVINIFHISFHLLHWNIQNSLLKLNSM